MPCAHCRREAAAKWRRIRKARAAKGLCQYCGKVPPRPGKKGCFQCLYIKAQKEEARKRKCALSTAPATIG